jgi:hypothetical protein
MPNCEDGWVESADGLLGVGGEGEWMTRADFG